MLQPLPYPVLAAMGRALGSLIVRLPVSFVRIARTNMGICLPELSDQQRELLLDEHFKACIGIFRTAISW